MSNNGDTERDQRLAAVVARLVRAIEAGDQSLASGPEAALETTALAECVDRDDFTARFTIGWLNWYGHAPLDRPGVTELLGPVVLFLSLVSGGATRLPGPTLAAAAAPHAQQLLQHTQVSSDSGPLTAAIDLWESLALATPDDEPARPGRLSNLGFLLRTRFSRDEDLRDLDAAIAHFESALSLAPADHPYRFMYQANLGSALLERFPHLGTTTDLDTAVNHLQVAASAIPSGHPDRTMCLSNLAHALLERFQQGGVQADLTAALGHLEEATSSAPAGHHHLPTCLYTYGRALLARFAHTGTEEDLGAALDQLRAAASVHTSGRPDPSRLASFADRLYKQFERRGTVACLNTAITLIGEAMDAVPVGQPSHAGLLFNLGAMRLSRYERTGDADDLVTAIDCLLRAQQRFPLGHQNHIPLLSNLANALRLRFEKGGDVADLDAAMQAAEKAVAATPADHPGRAARLSNLSAALMARFGHNRAPEDLDSAIEHARRTVQATADGDPHHAKYLSNLGGALHARFSWRGEPSDLQGAIGHFRDAIRLTPADRPDQPRNLFLLSDALYTRFERYGAAGDLAAAIQSGQDAVRLTPQDHPWRAKHLSYIGAALLTRFRKNGDSADLDAAVQAGQEAVDLSVSDASLRAGHLSNLGNALLTRFATAGAEEDLHAAVAAGREAAELLPDSDASYAGINANLGNALLDLFELSRSPSDLDGAVDSFRRAVDASGPRHSGYAEKLYSLGQALSLRSARDESAMEDRREAVTAWLTASAVESAAPSVRVDAARAAARALDQTGDAAGAADAAEAAVRLLPLVVPRYLERNDQQDALGGFSGLAGYAAALALDASEGTARSRAEQALRLLETGRAVLLGQAIESRGPLTDLRRQHPELADEFVAKRAQLDQQADGLDVRAEGVGDPFTLRQDRTGERLQLSEKFNALLAKIRRLDGFRSFALPPTLEDLCGQATAGDVVVFNLAARRSDALLLTSDGVDVLNLPSLNVHELFRLANEFQQAQLLATNEDRHMGQRAKKVLVNTLQWLWGVATGPVLEALGHHGPPADGATWPRVWWVTGGALGLLPIHAAGHHDDPADSPDRRTVLDRVVPSYTPSVSALRYARERALAPADEPSESRSLIVVMPTTPNQPDLSLVDEEASMVRTMVPNPSVLRPAAPVETPTDATATTATKPHVLALLPKCRIAHFTCHGITEPTDPSRSSLLLEDHEEDPLTVAALAHVALDHAQLAYLSACTTAAVHKSDLLDEALHLTSAFQLAGYPHVIGTLWRIESGFSLTVAKLFYAGLRTASGTIDPDRAPYALHKAIRWVRDGRDLRVPVDRTSEPHWWAAYLHSGA
ncbi:CHAT domain-containing protein [Streptomyces sp. NPDC048564]|uniref:CHAT domain-containing tetratricopeptide repeat protein n=1 Tax=Streptomyces sp. NPDC048564 TaxID=3155760 RepID=UPI0034499A2F